MTAMVLGFCISPFITQSNAGIKEGSVSGCLSDSEFPLAAFMPSSARKPQAVVVGCRFVWLLSFQAVIKKVTSCRATPDTLLNFINVAK
jgi:hypothetical protein